MGFFLSQNQYYMKVNENEMCAKGMSPILVSAFLV